MNKSRREALQRPPAYNAKRLPHQSHDLNPSSSAYSVNDSGVGHQPDSANNEADWRSGSEYRVRGSAYWHGRGRGRGRVRYGGATGRAPSFNPPRSTYRSASEVLNLGAGSMCDHRRRQLFGRHGFADVQPQMCGTSWLKA